MNPNRAKMGRFKYCIGRYEVAEDRDQEANQVKNPEREPEWSRQETWRRQERARKRNSSGPSFAHNSNLKPDIAIDLSNPYKGRRECRGGSLARRKWRYRSSPLHLNFKPYSPAYPLLPRKSQKYLLCVSSRSLPRESPRQS